VRTADAGGKIVVRRFHRKIARDSFGRTRIDNDRNPEDSPGDPRLLNTSIYDAVAKAEITLSPFSKQAKVMKQPSEHSTSPSYLEPSELPGLDSSQLQIAVHRE